MKVTIHQPEHLPWLGFFNKMDQADLLVLLDNVQYRKNYFQNRNRILGANGPMWLTVPVVSKGHTSSTIAETEISQQHEWRIKCGKSLRMAYANHSFFSDHAGFFEELYSRTWKLLAELNLEIIRYLASALGVRTEMVRASELGVAGASSQLLLDICRKTGANTYLAGQTAGGYLDETIFREARIEVTIHQFTHPTYPQRRQKDFVSHLSVIDLLFNCGPDSLKIIRCGPSGVSSPAGDR
ncbi:MAG: WbqC family protein [Acidobacteriia bacterium]|nr:WbqC family protein [Terriglobia bacterium]